MMVDRTRFLNGATVKRRDKGLRRGWYALGLAELKQSGKVAVVLEFASGSAGRMKFRLTSSGEEAIHDVVLIYVNRPGYLGIAAPSGRLPSHN